MQNFDDDFEKSQEYIDAPVIIIGGGPVGMAVALGLAHHGVKSILVERYAEPVRESRAFGIWPRTLEIIRAWDGLTPLLQTGTFYKTLAPVDARNERPIFSFNFDVLNGITSVAGALIIPQNTTENVLLELLRAKTECQQLTAECIGIEQDAQRVYVHIRQGELNKTLYASFVVACDGARSTVRKALGLELKGTTYPTRMVLSDERIDEQGLGALRFAVDRPGFLASVRFAPNLWRVMATVPSELSDYDAVTAKAQSDRIRTLFGMRHHETVWISQFHIYRRHCERFRVGRVLLAGDAAHLNSPAGGQGMNSGVQDAENIAWKLAYALQGGNIELLLDSYDRERREAVVSYVEQNSDRNSRIEFGFPTLLKPILFFLLKQAIHVRPISGRFARTFSMLDIKYTDSPLLFGHHPLVGTYLDDWSVDGQRRISDYFAGRAGIIAMKTSGLGVSINDIPVVYMHNVPKHWRLHGPSCIIVRPDRHVGAVIENPSLEKIASALQIVLGQQVIQMKRSL